MIKRPGISFYNIISHVVRKVINIYPVHTCMHTYIYAYAHIHKHSDID